MRKILPVALVLFLALGMAACDNSPNKPNVIMISVDTLRADRLGCYGNKEGITGMMDFWAERGVRFSNAWAPSPWTLPSHASAFTGLYPTEHRAIDDKINIDKDAVMLTERFKEAGFNTAAFVSHYYLGEMYGFGRGFKDFYIKPDAKADEMVTKATRWIKSNKDDTFFLFMHLFDPHTPYQPPVDIAKKHFPADVKVNVSGTTKDVMEVVHGWPSDDAKQKLRALSALYSGEIDFVDQQLEVLFKFLQENKLDENTLIVLFADHGEEFMEHGLMEHGFTLYQEQLAVPMIFFYPAGLPQGKVIDEPVSLIDLPNTLLSFLGLPLIENISGRDTMPLIRDEKTTLDRPLLAETTRQGPDRVTIIRDFQKFVYSPEFMLNGRSFDERLFDLAKDPEESTDLIDSAGDRAEKLRNELFSSGLYVQRRAWHIRWGATKETITVKGEIRTPNPGTFIYQYKDNTIYGVDDKGMISTREFPWEKRKDNEIAFINLHTRSNGIAFMTEPETADIGFHLTFNKREDPTRICLGSCDTHPGSGHFTLDKMVELTGDAEPPPGKVLIWTESVWVNSKQVLRAEVGDPIKLSAEVVDHLRSLGYVQ
jgi:arylsulfatase A-like enzyme